MYLCSVPRETRVVKGYFVSAHEFAELMRLRDRKPRAGFVWDMAPEMAAELEEPLPRNYAKRSAKRK